MDAAADVIFDFFALHAIFPRAFRLLDRLQPCTFPLVAACVACFHSAAVATFTRCRVMRRHDARCHGATCRDARFDFVAMLRRRRPRTRFTACLI